MRDVLMQKKQVAPQPSYTGSGQAAINNALLQNLALVCADLDKKLRNRIEEQKMTKLSETKVRIAVVFPRLLFR